MRRRGRPANPRGSTPAGKARGAAPGRVRIIGGRWRGSRLDVADVAGLRPTTDRTRETLFNWLQARVAGARCLDLFAGSGALGLEAASRGAASVVLVERDGAQAATLRDTAARLESAGPGGVVEVVTGDALSWLRARAGAPFDLVFLDPPFASDHWHHVFTALAPHLSGNAVVYLECAAGSLPVVPATWTMHRQARSHEVEARLFIVADTLGDSPSEAQDPNTG